MSDAPKTLADLKVGDRVVLCGHYSHELVIVERVTETMIVVPGHRFWRHKHGEVGNQIGAPRWLDTGEQAFTKARRQATNYLLQGAKVSLETASIMKMRAILDMAQAFLESVGEWSAHRD